MTMFGLTVFGDVCVGLAAFAAGVYFADWANSAWEKIKAAYGWLKSKV